MAVEQRSGHPRVIGLHEPEVAARRGLGRGRRQPEQPGRVDSSRLRRQDELHLIRHVQPLLISQDDRSVMGPVDAHHHRRWCKRDVGRLRQRRRAAAGGHRRGQPDLWAGAADGQLHRFRIGWSHPLHLLMELRRRHSDVQRSEPISCVRDGGVVYREADGLRQRRTHDHRQRAGRDREPLTAHSRRERQADRRRPTADGSVHGYCGRRHGSIQLFVELWRWERSVDQPEP